jgi:5-methylcytosine-specific restriction enzyme subunit McrC
MPSSIPIKNIYYMLCYAWNRLDDSAYIDIAEIPKTNAFDLFAFLLTRGIRRLLRAGLDRSYCLTEEEGTRPRGKLLVHDSVSRTLPSSMRVVCELTLLSEDTLENRILATTARRLLDASDLARELKDDLSVISRQLSSIPSTPLNTTIFRRAIVHRGNSTYRFLLNICELVHSSSLPSEESGRFRFREFARDSVKMRKLFEDFVRNFFSREQRVFSVGSERLSWNAVTEKPDSQFPFPDMITDISLTSSSRKIIIDTKFTPRTLQEYRGNSTYRSEHLYQIYAYVQSSLRFSPTPCTGVLLYPFSTTRLNSRHRIGNCSIRVVSLDLNLDWEDIHGQLIDLLND